MEIKERILDLLEQGKINAEEAAKLLDALKKSYHGDKPHVEVMCGPGHHPPRPPRPPRPRHIRKHIHRHHGHHGKGDSKKKIVIKLDGDCCEDICGDLLENIEIIKADPEACCE